jgi:hypothetical protein
VRKYKTLESWIKEAISDSDKEDSCTALALVYKKTEGGTREVHSIKLGGKTWKIEDLATLFKGKAEAYAQDFGGIQKFELQAFYGTKNLKRFTPFLLSMVKSKRTVMVDTFVNRQTDPVSSRKRCAMRKKPMSSLQVLFNKSP